MAILEETAQLLFAGVNFVFAPPPPLDQQRSLGFRLALAESKMEFDHSDRSDQGMLLVRTQGSPLQVQVLRPAPPAGQLLVIAENPLNTLDL